MEIGVSAFITDEGPDPARLAAHAEERGFASLFLPEHTHIPVRRESRWPGGDGPLPRAYLRSADPFVALAMAAQATTRLRLGTAVTLLAQRDPIVTAKEIATLDRFSGGRTVLGVGAGWNREEARNHGVPVTRRTAVAAEHIRAMTAIWAQDQPEFHGEFVDFDPIHCWPKPLRRPEVLVGGWGRSTFDRILDHADGWLAPRTGDLDTLVPGITELRRRAAARGRDVTVTAYARPDAPGDLQRAAELGVDRAIVDLTQCRPADVPTALDRHARLTAAVPLGRDRL